MKPYLRTNDQTMLDKPLSHIDIAHFFWKMQIKPGDIAVDATAGNGHDSAFLASLGAHVIAFDIQPQALEQTKLRLQEYPAAKCTLYNLCHSRMKEVLSPQSVQFICFNLGYLPGGDKSITTQVATTVEAIESSLELIVPKGLISITCYPGHPEGLVEEEAIVAMCQKLDPKKWAVTSHRFINRNRYPHLLQLTKIF